MHVITKRTLQEFWERHPEAKQELQEWHAEVKSAKWDRPEDVRLLYPKASFLKDNRIVFNIHHNDYRLVVKVNYPGHVVFVRAICSHAEYDRMDVESI